MFLQGLLSSLGVAIQEVGCRIGRIGDGGGMVDCVWKGL